jgi:carboxyl-terminal processing protease
MRLTTSYYYTPTGRCIQKPFKDGLENYYNDLNNRYKHGEFLTPDNISFPDSLKYYTPKKRIVYGGGGIMPDIFVPIDTTKYSTLYNELVRKGVFGSFTLDYMDTHKAGLLKKYPTIEDFKNNFVISDELYKDFMNYAKKEGVKDTVPLLLSNRLASFVKEKQEKIDSLYKNIEDMKEVKELETMILNYVKDSYTKSINSRNEEKAPVFIKEFLKFEMARNMFNYGEAYQIFLMSDDAFLQAAMLMQDNKAFKKFNVSSK